MDSDNNTNNVNPANVPVNNNPLDAKNKLGPANSGLFVMPTSEKEAQKVEVEAKTIDTASLPLRPQGATNPVDSLILVRPPTKPETLDLVSQTVSAPFVKPIPEDEVKKTEIVPEKNTPTESLISQMKPTDDAMIVKPAPVEDNGTNTGRKNIQAAWSRYHPEKEELVEDYKGTGIYSYVEKPNTVNTLAQTQTVKAAQPVKDIVRTFQRDVEEAVKYNHISSVDIALSEQKRRLEQERAGMMRPSEGEDIKRFQIIMYVIIGLLLVGGGIALIYFFIVPAITQTPTTQTVNQNIGYNLLRTEEKTTIDLSKIDKTKLAVVLRNAIETNAVLPNNIQEIVFSDTDNLGNVTNIDSLTFLSLVGITPPPELARDLQKPFIYGLHNLKTNQPFLILYTGAYSSGFNGMWSWQSNGMIRDFKKIFVINDTPATTGTTTQTQGELFFQDAIIRSLNSWVVKNALGNIILAYTIYDNNTVIISTNTETIKTIVDRMIAEKTQAR